MMKTKRSIFLALMATAALFFAAGCSDSSDDAWEEESEASSESSTASETVASDDSGSVESAGSTGSAESSAGSSDSGSSTESGTSDSSNAGSTEGDGADGSAESSDSGSSTGSGSAGSSGSGSSTDSGSTSESSSTVSSTGGSAGSSGGGSSAESGSAGSSDSGITLIEITEDNVEALLQNIGKVTGDNERCYWDYANGTLTTDDEGCTFAVSWVDENKSNKYNPDRVSAISNLQKKGKVSTALLTVDLSDADWDEEPSSNSGITTGTIIVSIELTDSAAGSYTIPESLQSVTIALENSKWINN